MDTGIFIAGVGIGIWLLSVVFRVQPRSHIPWFAYYVLWELLATSAQFAFWLINHKLYFEAYWWIESIEIALTVAAVRESFLRIFRGFTPMLWFRLLVSGLIAAALAYGGWKAIYHPPVEGTAVTAFIINTEFAFRWGIAAIAALTVMLTYRLTAASRTRESSVINGFGIIAGTFIICLSTVSLFGTRYLFLSKYAPSVGYFLAAIVWIRAFSQPLKGPRYADLGLGPEDMLQVIRSYRKDVQGMRGKE